MMKTKILFVDLFCTQTYFYTITKFFQDAGLEADLLIASNLVERKPTESPFFHDKTAKDKKWIYLKEFSYSVFSQPLNFIKKELDLIKFFRQYDILISTGVAPLWHIFANKPFIFVSLGSDIDQFALCGFTGDPKSPTEVIPPVWRNRFMSWILRFFYIHCLKYSKNVFIAPHQLPTIKKLKIPNFSITNHVHVIDTDVFKPLPSDIRNKEKQKNYKEFNCDLLLFNPSRQIWKDRTVTDCKGNDKVFRAFKKFIDIEKDINPKLLLIEKGWDVGASKELIKELGIENYVIWKKEMPRNELTFYYNIADIVFDQFEIGVLSLSAVEPMACGSSVISYVKEVAYNEMPPLINAYTEEEIFEAMLTLGENKELRETTGQKCYEWIEKYCNKDVTIQIYVNAIKNVLNKK